ncbi:MAG: histidine phosphatase family protein [Planctomycetes bacterium]|nr:histidine phosphatase family protein [Planctomycetota bacterium]
MTPITGKVKFVPFQQGSNIPEWESLRRRLSTAREHGGPIVLNAIRHGETETNAKGLVTGAQDVDLTDRGREQARATGHLLHGRYDAAICSSLRRSRETLAIALAAGGVSVTHCFWDARLNERCLGDLELRPALPISGYANGDFSFAPKGGNSYRAVVQRALSFLLDLADWSRDQGASTILLSTHMGFLRILAGILEEQTDPVAVLARSFRNAELLTWKWVRVTWPRFLESGG